MQIIVDPELKLIQTKTVTTPFYPKFHATNSGRFEIIESGAEELEIEKFLLEPTALIPEGVTTLVSIGSHGTFYVRLDSGSGDVQLWLYPTGEFNDGTYRISQPFTEDTTPQVDVLVDAATLQAANDEQIDRILSAYDTGHNVVVTGLRFVGGVQ